MSTPGPAEAELQRSIQEHLSYRPDSEIVASLWRGYLAALAEFDLISVGTHAHLVSLLPKVGLQELNEMLGGVPGMEQGSGSDHS